MKLRTLVQNEAALRALGKIKFGDGAMALRFAKSLKPFVEEVDEYYKLRDQFVMETGKTEVRPGDPEYAEIARKLAQALEVDVDVKPTYKFKEGQFAGIELTVEAAQLIASLGLLEDEQ
jgi:hypothetical protein